MSVIAWDGRTIAADRMGIDCDCRIELSKMRKLADGKILAWTGSQNSGLAMARWFENGADPLKLPPSQNKDDWSRLVVVEPGGRCYSYEQYPEPIEAFGKFQGWGSGRDFALGALAMGADARKAVEIACMFSVGCGFGVEAYDLTELSDHTPETIASPRSGFQGLITEASIRREHQKTLQRALIAHGLNGD